jgi:hypothetical protein
MLKPCYEYCALADDGFRNRLLLQQQKRKHASSKSCILDSEEDEEDDDKSNQIRNKLTGYFGYSDLEGDDFFVIFYNRPFRYSKKNDVVSSAEWKFVEI